MKWLVLGALTALLLLTPHSTLASPPSQTRGERFESVSCGTFKVPASAYTCGYVSVPELHADPNGRQIKLAVAILPSTNRTPTTDAYVVAQGGPGGSTLDTFASFFQPGYYPSLETLRAERDIVLYDQRGTLYSQPALLCPEELDETFQTIEQAIPPVESLRRSEQALLACRTRLLNAGIHLAAYNSIENALDIEDVRAALGYEKFDLYGVSYGTLLALHGLRETPDTFRSVILDAVVPTQINPNSAIAESENRVFEQLFNTCAADADCHSAFPDLKQVLYAQVDALNEKPARVPLTDKETGKTYNAVLDGDTLMDILFQFIYNTELVPALPQMIYDVRAGQYPLIKAFYPTLIFDRTFASGMYYSVMCAEDADFGIQDLDLGGVDPHIAAAQTRDTAAFLQLCQKWDVPALGARADEPVSATVPTLVFSGDFDPITPPPNGAAAAATISPSYVYEFPAYGHGAMTSGNCPNEMIAAFVRDPAHAPNAACIKTEASRVTFVTPTNTLLSEGIGTFQFNMLQGKLQAFVVPIVLELILLSVWFIGPLAWLIRRARKLPSEAQAAARLAPWLAALASLVALGFFFIVFVLLIVVSLRNENTIRLVLGAPHEWLVVYLMPLFFMVCAVALVVLVVLAWQRHNWGVLRRVYFSLVALAALALVVWFAFSGILLPGVNL